MSFLDDTDDDVAPAGLGQSLMELVILFLLSYILNVSIQGLPTTWLAALGELIVSAGFVLAVYVPAFFISFIIRLIRKSPDMRRNHVHAATAALAWLVIGYFGLWYGVRGDGGI